MAAWDYQRLQRSLEKGEAAPVYCLFGEETYLLQESLQMVIKECLGEGLADFNLDIFYAQDLDASAVRDAAEQLPMMAARRIVVVKEAQELKEKHWNVLLPIIESPVDSTVLVLVASKIDQRKAVFKKIAKNGVLVKFDRPYDNQLGGWIGYIGNRHGKTLSSEANQLLAQMVGNNLMDIHNEIQKLCQFIGDKNPIEKEDVEKVVSRVRVESVFTLANAIGGSDRATALESLANLLDHGQNAIGVLAMISRHIRLLLLAKEGRREGLTPGPLARRMGVPQFFVKDYIHQSENWQLRRLEQLHGLLLKTDRALKSSPVASHIWLENFVVEACQTPPKTSSLSL